MYSRKIEEYKKSLKLNQEQKEILIGLMLGDGHLETQNKGRTFRLKIEQSITKKDYVMWLRRRFNNFVISDPRIMTKQRNFAITHNFGFSTLSHACFRFYAQQFYRGKKKVVPKSIGKFLTPLAIAVWFMDDGSIKSKKHRAKIINTQGFSKQEVQKLVDILEKKFNIESKLRKQKEGYQIYLLAKSIDTFIELLDKYVIDSMRYKLK